MQRLRKDRNFILAEVKGLVLKSTAAQSVEYMNEAQQRVKDLAAQMREKGLQPTQRSTLVMLKTFLQARHCEALQCYSEIPDLPKHVGTQLVEIACRDRRLQDILPKLTNGQIPMTTDSLNLLLNESIRSGQPDVAKQALELAEQQSVEKNSRTYSLLVRAETDPSEVRRLLNEVSRNG
eukprot:Skav219763  [mRNA]  locus=scaffold569:316836:320715:- [translate_table: standard]